MYFEFYNLIVFTFSAMFHLWKHCSNALSSLAFQTDSNADNSCSKSFSEKQSTRPHKSLLMFCTPNISSKNDFFNSLPNPQFSKYSSAIFL